MSEAARHLWTNARVWDARTGEIHEDWAVACDDTGGISWTGPSAEAPDSDEITDCEDRLITPGLVDCHTHLVYAGDRSGEWQARLEGASYEDIARAGGGIKSTVKAVREASEDELLAQTLPRLQALLAEGVTTVEIKSGYGLNTENEVKLLNVANRICRTEDVHALATYLGAHSVPAGMSADKYIDDVIENQFPAIAKLADAVDVFCETIGFTLAQTERVMQAAKAHGLDIKIHAEQLSNMGGTRLAAKYSALSADHLEYIDEDGVKAMADAGMVAVLLPGAFYFLKETKKPPVDLFRKYKVPMAVATDCNPGTSPLTSPLMCMNMACTFFGLTPTEAFQGMTINGSKALDVLDSGGVIEPDMTCDLAIWNAGTPAELIYNMGASPLWQRVWMGEITS